MSWSKIKLENLCNVVTKGTTPTTLGYDFTPEGIPFLRIQNINSTTVSMDEILFIDQVTHSALKRSAIYPGDVLITIAGTIGRVAIVPDGFPECNCNQAVAIIRFDRNKLDSKYLLHWLTSADARVQIAGKKVTATISNLSLGQIKELEIPLPPLSTQKKIAAILEKADQLRRDCQKMEQEFNNLAESVFIKNYLQAKKNTLTFEDLSVKVKNSFVNGPFGSDLLSSELTDTGVPVIYIRDIASGVYARKKKVYVTAEKAAELNYCRVDAGDVLIAKVGDPPGMAAIYPAGQPNAIITQDVIRIKCDESLVIAEYLIAYLNSNLGIHSLKAITVEATRSRIGLGDLKKLKVELPSKDDQMKFVELSRQLTLLKNRNSILKVQYENKFNSLVQKAFNGELNLKNKAA